MSRRSKRSRAQQRRCQRRRVAARSPRRRLRAALQRLLPRDVLAGLPAHGNTRWALPTLAALAVVWAWAGEATLTDRFELARQALAHWQPLAYLATSYQGFVQALATHHQALVAAVAGRLRALMAAPGPWGTVAGWQCFVADSSKVAVPWTAANEADLGKAGRKPKGDKCRRAETDLRPQLLVTLLWHLGWQLPWGWAHGGVAANERGLLRGLLALLPRGALLIADAGFTGYEFWQAVLANGQQLLVRVGANVRLLRDLVPGAVVEVDGERVWLWPDGRREAGRPPLELRLLRLTAGRQTVWLVTSVLDPGRLTDAQAAALYRARWGVECQFRALKQTFERRKLHSYTPEHARLELDWSLLGLWLLGLLAKQELAAAGTAPGRHSPAAALRLVRREVRRWYNGREQLDVAELARAVTDDYRRTASKRARHDQRKKRDPAPGEPKIARASPAQRRAAKALGVAHCLAA
jgi:hypothetical protein